MLITKLPNPWIFKVLSFEDKLEAFTERAKEVADCAMSGPVFRLTCRRTITGDSAPTTYRFAITAACFALFVGQNAVSQCFLMLVGWGRGGGGYIEVVVLLEEFNKRVMGGKGM